MKFLFCLIISLLLWEGVDTSNLLAQQIEKVQNPKEIRTLQDVPEEIRGLEWNRWTSQNFTVLCLDQKQAEYLHKHLELVKSWVFSRWGFYDSDFSAECKLVAVNDPDLYKKMFRITGSQVEVRRDDSGRIQETVIFMLINDTPSHTIPIPLSEVCLAEFAQKHNMDIGWWAYRGMSLLDGSLDQIRAEIQQLNPRLENNQPVYFSQGLLEMTKEQYRGLSKEQQLLYDQVAIAFCLLVRKEFGQDKFHKFLQVSSQSGTNQAIVDVLGFEGYDDFDPTFKRYLMDLSKDVGVRKTPDRYLQIRGKGNFFSF